MKLIDKEMYFTLMEQEWAWDLCGCFADADDFLARGLGVAVTMGGDLPVSGAASYAVCDGAIEIEIDTRPDFRCMGLATACGGKMILEAVAQIEAGTASRIPQDHEQATLAPMLSKALSPVDWTRSAWEIHNQIRGLVPWPSATTDVITGDTMKLHRSCLPGTKSSACPGVIVAAGKEGIDIACGDGQVLRILELQAPGKKKMSAAAYLAGNPIQVK